MGDGSASLAVLPHNAGRIRFQGHTGTIRVFLFMLSFLC